MELSKYGITLSRLTESDLEVVRGWRNDPKISQYLVFRDHITREMQRKWFRRIDNDENFYFLIKVDASKIGLTHVKDIDREMNCGEVGIFIYEDRYANSLTGFQAMLSILDFAFDELKLDHLVGRILKENTRSIRFNETLGFELHDSREAAEYDIYVLREAAYRRVRENKIWDKFENR